MVTGHWSIKHCVPQRWNNLPVPFFSHLWCISFWLYSQRDIGEYVPILLCITQMGLRWTRIKAFFIFAHFCHCIAIRRRSLGGLGPRTSVCARWFLHIFFFNLRLLYFLYLIKKKQHLHKHVLYISGSRFAGEIPCTLCVWGRALNPVLEALITYL